MLSTRLRTDYTAALQAEINSQIAVWDGVRIVPYAGAISLGTGYFLNISASSSWTPWQ